MNDEEVAYKFSELDPKTQERVIEKFRRILHEHFDVAQLTEWFKDRLNEVALPSDKVYWSLSWSQGDGVGFYGSINVEDYLEKNNLKSDYPLVVKADSEGRISISIVGDGRYHTMRVDCDISGSCEPCEHEDCEEHPEIAEACERDREESLKAEFEDLCSHIEDHVKTMASELEKAGYADIEYQTGDEAIGEFLESNDYKFDEDGVEIR